MRHRSGTRLLIAVATVITLGCGAADETADRTSAVEEALQRLIESVVDGDDAIHGAAMAVSSPRLGLEWAGAAGFADPGSGLPMTPSTPVRIASNTKTYVAAAILRLAEDWRLDLDAPVSGLLPPEVVDLLQSDGYDLDAMTPRHLLTHTSGLVDHTESSAYIDAIIADPGHRWTQMEQIAMAVETGDPHAPPGEIYTYCDTGYVLLGLILERASGQPLPTAVRSLIGFRAMGLDSTWWETLEPAPQGVGDRAHQFLGELDTHDFDPSFDLYGGGGIVAPVGDLAGFFGGLFRGDVFSDPATVDLMLTTLDGIAARPNAGDRALAPGVYRMGVWVIETAGHTSYHHTGFWGTLAVYVPDLDLAIAATLNQNRARPALDRLPVEAIRIIEDEELSS